MYFDDVINECNIYGDGLFYNCLRLYCYIYLFNDDTIDY